MEQFSRWSPCAMEPITGIGKRLVSIERASNSGNYCARGQTATQSRRERRGGRAFGLRLARRVFLTGAPSPNKKSLSPAGRSSRAAALFAVWRGTGPWLSALPESQWGRAADTLALGLQTYGACRPKLTSFLRVWTAAREALLSGGCLRRQRTAERDRCGGAHGKADRGAARPRRAHAAALGQQRACFLDFFGFDSLGAAASVSPATGSLRFFLVFFSSSGMVGPRSEEETC